MNYVKLGQKNAELPKQQAQIFNLFKKQNLIRSISKPLSIYMI